MKIFAILFIITVGYGRTLEAKTNHIGFGSSEIDFPTGTSLAGYGHIKRRLLSFDVFRRYDHATLFKPSLGQLDPLRAKSTYIRRGDKDILFVSLDIIAVVKKAREDIIRAIKKDLELDIDHVVVSAAHTHSSSGGLSDNKFWQIFGLDWYNQQNYDALFNATMKSIKEAVDQQKPAQLYYKNVELTGLTFNRRDLSKGVNTEALLIVAKDMSQNIIGGMINYAMHGTYYREENLYLSSDAPGEVERRLEKVAHLGNADQNRSPVFSFTSGAAGDIDPDFKAHATLQELGDAFEGQIDFEDLKEIDLNSHFDVQVKKVELPPAELNLNNCMDSFWIRLLFRKNIKISNYLPEFSEVMKIELGDLDILTFPGEISHSIFQNLNRLMSRIGKRDRTLAVMALTNDHLSYFLDSKEYEVGGYEACASFYGKFGYEKFIKTYTEF